MYQGDETALEPVKPTQIEVLPAAAPRSIWRSAVWPALGSALIWAGRELLPQVLAAWQASRTGAAQPVTRQPGALLGLTRPSGRVGHRHRWGRRA